MEREEKNQQSFEKQNISDVLNKYKESKGVKEEEQPIAKGDSIPKTTFDSEKFENVMNRETDPDLIISYELIDLPSKGLFYKTKKSQVRVEYMTSRDEDILTTPSLIENGTVLDVLLKRKIKDVDIKPDELLPGDRNAIILFLRTSSYGADYSVEVIDPRNGKPFKTEIDLSKLRYKKMEKLPDEDGFYTVKLPMRKKTVKFRLLSSGEDTQLFKKAEAIKEAYGNDFSEYNTMKLKSHVVSIEGNSDRSYIDKFIDAMPALDAYTIRKELLNVSPDVDMEYEFKAKDGYKFKSYLSVGVDFFFPNT